MLMHVSSRDQKIQGHEGNVLTQVSPSLLFVRAVQQEVQGQNPLSFQNAVRILLSRHPPAPVRTGISGKQERLVSVGKTGVIFEPSRIISDDGVLMGGCYQTGRDSGVVFGPARRVVCKTGLRACAILPAVE